MHVLFVFFICILTKFVLLFIMVVIVCVGCVQVGVFYTNVCMIVNYYLYTAFEY